MAGKTEDLDQSGLSPEEIAALNGDDGGDTQALDAIIGDADPEDDDAGLDVDPDADAGDEADGDADPENKPEDAAAVVDAPANAQAAEFQPQVVTQPVENFAQKMEAFETQKAELRTKLNDGDIDLEEYEKLKDAVTDQATELRMQQRDHENEVKRRTNEGAQRWQWEQEQFFGRAANQIYSTNRLLNAALDTAVKDLANDPANAQQTGSWFLEEADRQVRALMAGTVETAKDAEKKPAKADRKPDLTGIPKTLSTIPAAEAVDTGGAEFDYLDKLTGAALEQALAAIAKDPIKEARYLRT